MPTRDAPPRPRSNESRAPRGSSAETSRVRAGPRCPSRRAAQRGDASARRLFRYLPLALVTTALVIVFPTLFVTALVPPGDAISTAASVALAVGASLLVASAEAALWKRWRRSRDIVFADLMIWGWARRVWTERRLARAQDLLAAAGRGDSRPSIETLTRVSQLLEARDAYTQGHSQRVMRHAGRIAHGMDLPPAEVAKIRIAASVHDVGKLHTPREVLNNPGRLTDAEYAVMKRHATDGADMLAGIGAPDIAAMVRHHHERIDGSGYPDGLAGPEIPLGARIIAVADTFDAITSARPYRPASSQKRALTILSTEAGSRLDKDAVATFLSLYSSRRSLAAFAFAATLPQLGLAALRTTTSSFAVGVGGLASIVPALGAAGGLALTQASRTAQTSAKVAPAVTHVGATASASTRQSHVTSTLGHTLARSGRKGPTGGHGRGGRNHGLSPSTHAIALTRTHVATTVKALAPSGAPTHAPPPTKAPPVEPTKTTPVATPTTTTPTETTRHEPPPTHTIPVEVPPVTPPGTGKIEVPTKVPTGPLKTG